MKLKNIIAAASILVLSIFTASAQNGEHRLAHANGAGTLKVGQEQFKVNAVVVKLLEDRKVELTLVSDITVFISGTWSQNADSQDQYEIQITGGASPGGLDGSGRVTLSKESNSNVKLILKGKSRTTKKNIEVYFVSK